MILADIADTARLNLGRRLICEFAMPPLDPQQRQLFDDLLEQIIEQLPDQLERKLEEVPVIVEDEPSALMLEQLGRTGEGGLLCGLHWGISLPARSVEHSGTIPDRIRLFRQPIISVARWDAHRLTPIAGRRIGRFQVSIGAAHCATLSGCDARGDCPVVHHHFSLN